MKNFRDIEQLSSYLDGQLSPSDSARIESRISSDPEVASVLNDLRITRGILRKLPARKAPRNFTLTRQMAGLKPPMPRSYSFFRFSTAFASILFILTFAANGLIPRINIGVAASIPAVQENFGSGGGCDTCTDVATEAPALMPEPSIQMAAPAATEAPAASADSARVIETPVSGEQSPKAAGNESGVQNQNQVKGDAFVPVIWQIVLLILGLVSAIISFIMNQNARKKWK